MYFICVSTRTHSTYIYTYMYIVFVFAGGTNGAARSGRVQLANLPGRTSGGIFGPLPAYEFCIDIVIVETSGSVNSASIVNFDTATSTPAQPTFGALSGDVSVLISVQVFAITRKPQLLNLNNITKLNILSLTHIRSLLRLFLLYEFSI